MGEHLSWPRRRADDAAACRRVADHDVVHWPGYLLIVAGVVGGVRALAAFGTGHHAERPTLVWWRLSSQWLVWRGWRSSIGGLRKIADRWYLSRRPEVGGSGWPARHPSAAEIPASRGFTGSFANGMHGCLW